MVDSSYGARFWPVWRSVLRDYRLGDGRRARARLGFLTPPEGRGRVVWIKAGAGATALRLGVELLGAVRDRRRDVRVVLTFEQDDPHLLKELLQPWPKIGIGYGPCDRPRVVRRVLARFQPCGIILAEPAAAPMNLLSRTLSSVAAVGAPEMPFPGGVVWPISAANEWDCPDSGHSGERMPAADPQARFVEAQVDVVLRTLTGGDERRLWWWHGRVAQWPQWLAAWRRWEHARSDILMFSLADAGDPGEKDVVKVSAWGRQPLPGGALLHIDDRRWFAAAASAAAAGHLAVPGRDVLWQALAAGCALTLGADAGQRRIPAPVLPEADEVIRRWGELRGDFSRRRVEGDAARRRFWDERRQVDTNLTALMDRVWTW